MVLGRPHGLSGSSVLNLRHRSVTRGGGSSVPGGVSNSCSCSARPSFRFPQLPGEWKGQLLVEAVPSSLCDELVRARQTWWAVWQEPDGEPSLGESGLVGNTDVAAGLIENDGEAEMEV